MQFMQVGCNYLDWNRARLERIILSVLENAVATYGITSRNYFKTFAHPIDSNTLLANVRDLYVIASAIDVFLCF